MQVCRCAYVDSVTDPSLFPFPRHSNVCYSFTKEAYHRSSIRDFSLGQGLRISLRKKRIPRISESNHCLQSSTEASWGKIRTARPGRQADGVKDKGTSTHDRVHLDDVLDEIIYVSPQIYPTEKDAPIEFDARAPYLQTSRTHVGRQKLSVRTTISSSENERTLDPGIVASSRKKDDLAALRWLRNMGEAYGSSLILLVGSGYCIQGFRCFPWFLVNFYFKDVLTVDPGTLQVIQNTVNLPMVAKPVYGIISDAVYIGGAHRVPYLVIGGFLQAISWVAIAFLPGDGSSICIIAVLLAFSNLGASIVDVANDALVAECAKKKRTTGELQSFSWLSTSVGGVLGNLTGAFALSWIDFRVMFSMFGMLLACQASKSLSVNEGHFGLHMSDIFDSRREKREGLKTMPMKAISDVYNGPTRAAYAFAFEDTKDMWMHPKINDERLGYPSMRLGEDAGCKQDSIDLPDTAYWSTQSVRPETLTVQQPAKLDGMQKQFVDLLNLTQHLKIDPSVVGMSKVMGQIGLVGASMVYTRCVSSDGSICICGCDKSVQDIAIHGALSSIMSSRE
ncbi:hypothetical protein KP509_10G017200 [Ceratopteris richardii]|uniref:Uncharacterized protein n=1 Tax=Ceratopteris richardii TaxID=49495 RepID=A0A8T2TYQ9_CERRI|nr:hypothetical protein KP509_10G017200 [Ceratopteris richardii]